MGKPRPVEITGFTPDGRGEGTDELGRTWAIKGAPPGSLVLAVGRTKEGVALEVLRPADDAVTPPCPAFEVCGGCTWQQMPLSRQRAEKQAMLERLLAPLGGEALPLLGVPEAPGEEGGPGGGYRYRNKADLSFGAYRYLSAEDLAAGAPMEGRWLGMHARGRFDRIADRDDCMLLSEAAAGVLQRARADILATPWPVWRARDHVGFWRHLVLREGRNGVLALIYTAPGDEEQEAWLRSVAPTWGAAGVLWYTTTATADASVGDLRAHLFGVSEVEEQLAGVRYRLSPTAFFQVNPRGAELLCQAVEAAACEGRAQIEGTLLDLYCGVGTLGLALAHRFSKLVGVESHAPAVEDARRNAALNGIAAEFFTGPLEALVGELPRYSAPLTAIVDPPRAGLHPKALAWVAKLPAERLVYVACRPASLLRDGLALKEAGWVCRSWRAVDLFPQTGHVEVVSAWERPA